VVPVTVMCSGRVDPQHVLWAFERGADGVLVAGCHPGDCHYGSGNLLMRRRMAVLRTLLSFVGLEPGRLWVAYVSASEGAKFARICREMTEEVRKLGPNKKLNRERVISR